MQKFNGIQQIKHALKNHGENMIIYQETKDRNTDQLN